MKYKVADLVFEMEPNEWTKRQAERYVYNGEAETLFFIEPCNKETYDEAQIKGDFEGINVIKVSSLSQAIYLARNGLK